MLRRGKPDLNGYGLLQDADSFCSEDAEVDAAEVEEEPESRDLVYEAMKMRTGFTESRDKDAIR